MREKHDQQEFATRVRDMLNASAGNLDQRVATRLYEARCDALRHQGAPVAALSVAHFGHILSESLHNHYRGILAFVALAIGAIGVQLWQNNQEAADLAEIDSALLSDEVSPSAYTDQGFLEWLHHLSEQENDSLPE
jgi:hypothetical protein